MEFENNGLGKCVILKDSSKYQKLIYAISSKQFIIVRNLDIQSGNWGGGSYFGNDLDNALSTYNDRVKSEQIIER